LQTSCRIGRTAHSASIACFRPATAVFALAPYCSNHSDADSLIHRTASRRCPFQT